MDPQLSEAIIDAAARAETVPGGEALGELLGAIHGAARAEEIPDLPLPAEVGSLPMGPAARRFAIRTGIAATAAVIGLAGTAAALAGGLVLLEPVISDGSTTVSAAAEVSAVDDVDEQDGNNEAPLGADDVVTVDASDGLDEEELAVLCEAAENHGEYVSAVARDRAGDDDGSHGDRVREAAQSDCGKNDQLPSDEELPAEDTAADDGALVDPTDGLDDAELEALCAEAGNHGEYVSAVARDRVGDGDGSHGERVREAAQSDCGKDGAEDGGSSDATDENDEGDGKDNGNGQGNGNGNGQGSGNGQGNGNGPGEGKGNGNGQGNGQGNGKSNGNSGRD